MGDFFILALLILGSSRPWHRLRRVSGNQGRPEPTINTKNLRRKVGPSQSRHKPTHWRSPVTLLLPCPRKSTLKPSCWPQTCHPIPTIILRQHKRDHMPDSILVGIRAAVGWIYLSFTRIGFECGIWHLKKHGEVEASIPPPMEGGPWMGALGR